ncbi:MAG: glutamate-5-semialdehyde dehydrogenase, partial [Candidatus Gracilibacteria bacterium]
PNVVTDIFALCFKAKNGCVLKGGSDCQATNEALMKLIKKSMEKFLKNSDAAVLLPNDKKVIGEFMKSDRLVNVLIPRGGAGLIDFVRKNSSIPVIETGAGVVHVFFDESGKTDMGKQIILNAKTQRPSVCNAMDTLLMHEKKLPELPDLCVMLEEKGVEIFADAKAYEALKGRYKDELLKKAEKDSFGCEFLSLQMAVKTVANVDEAIEHINTFGSGHSEAIITDNRENSEKFLEEVDAACVYVNASTRFTDGGEFGMGAEVGISTQKLHARGPMGLRELTSYKWEVVGSGQVR